VGLTQYIKVVVDAGFATATSLYDISEDDLEKLKVKLGHRRILQREIFRRSGGSDHEAIDLSSSNPGVC
jgi:hypothetical protein